MRPTKLSSLMTFFLFFQNGTYMWFSTGDQTGKNISIPIFPMLNNTVLMPLEVRAVRLIFHHKPVAEEYVPAKHDMHTEAPAESVQILQWHSHCERSQVHTCDFNQTAHVTCTMGWNQYLPNLCPLPLHLRIFTESYQDSWTLNPNYTTKQTLWTPGRKKLIWKKN